MTYTIDADGYVFYELADGSTACLPPTHNGTEAWDEYQTWLDAPNTPTPQVQAATADYRAFWAALIDTGFYGTMKAQAEAGMEMNVAVTEFIALMGDAKNGMAMATHIQNCIDWILTAGTFSAGELAELQSALEGGNLDGIYTLGA